MEEISSKSFSLVILAKVDVGAPRSTSNFSGNAVAKYAG